MRDTELQVRGLSVSAMLRGFGEESCGLGAVEMKSVKERQERQAGSCRNVGRLTYRPTSALQAWGQQGAHKVIKNV